MSTCRGANEERSDGGKSIDDMRERMFIKALRSRVKGRRVAIHPATGGPRRCTDSGGGLSQRRQARLILALFQGEIILRATSHVIWKDRRALRRRHKAQFVRVFFFFFFLVSACVCVRRTPKKQIQAWLVTEPDVSVAYPLATLLLEEIGR